MNNLAGQSLSRNDFLILSGGALGAGLVGCSGGGGNPGLVVPALIPSPASAAAAPPSVPSNTASISVSRSQAGKLPPTLAGLSYEKSTISANFFTSANASLIGCFARLGASVLRIGGNSVDKTTWAPSGPGSTSGQVAPSDVRALAAFLQSAGWRIIYGINLATNTPASAAAEAAYASSTLGDSLFAFEIGNECDLYSSNGLRPSTYDISDFIAEWSTLASAIRQTVPNAPLSGPASGGWHVATWTAPFASAESSQIEMITQHYYRADGLNANSTMSLLLTPDPGLPIGLNALEALANSLSLGYRLAECNSFYDGGAPNVSDAFGSALWAADFMLMSAQYGSAGVNFHGGGDGPGYTPIADNNVSVVGLRPVYYGMLFVAQIAPGPMYVVNVTAEVAMTAYAIAGNDGATYVAIINKNPLKEATTTIALGEPASAATALVLSGSGLSATTGTTLGGAAIANDGAWTPTGWHSLPVSGSNLTVRVAAATALLLRIT